MCAEAAGLIVSPERIDIYLHGLDDLPFDRLIDVLDRWPRKSKFFPAIVELRELVMPAPNEDAAAEAAWVSVEDWIRKWYHGDMGLLSIWSGGDEIQPPQLDVRTEHACRMIGHYRRIHAAIQSPDQYTWIKKEFCAAWKMAEDVAVCMGDPKLLEAIMQGPRPPAKVLPRKPGERMTAAEGEAARQEFKRMIRANEQPAKPTWKPLTPEQFEARKALLRRQAMDLIQDGTAVESG